MTTPSVIVGADGRAKAYRPLPDPERSTAVVSGLRAYDEGDFFEAHELLEPAWMGTPDPAERSLLQGLIKVAAADVHAVRGNPAGIQRNLVGARERLQAGVGGTITGVIVDVPGLLQAIDGRLASLANGDDSGPLRIDWMRR